MSKFLLGAVLLVSGMSFGQYIPDNPNDGFCSLSFKVRSIGRFDSQDQAREFCEFHKSSCRVVWSRGKWQGVFFLTQKIDSRNANTALVSYNRFLRDKGYLTNRYSHSFRLSNCK